MSLMEILGLMGVMGLMGVVVVDSLEMDWFSVLVVAWV